MAANTIAAIIEINPCKTPLAYSSHDYQLLMGALAELEQARLDLKRTLVIASRHGTISKHPKVGQYMKRV